jgi:hypothetical protein
MEERPREEESATGIGGLFADAATRHGALHLRRCAAFGVSRDTIRHRARRERWTRRPDIVLRTSRTLDESDIHLVNGLRCTTPERTMRDLAEVLPHVAPLRAIGIDAFRDEVLDLALLHAEVEAMRPGAARDRLAEVAADLARVRTESPFAYEVLEAMAELGLPVEGEFPWRCPDGRIIHHDGAVPWAWVSVECDGRGKYASGGSFTTDRVRWSQTSGQWRTVWVTWQRWLPARAAVLQDIQTAVAAADPSRSPPVRADCRCRRCRRWARRQQR